MLAAVTGVLGLRWSAQLRAAGALEVAGAVPGRRRGSGLPSRWRPGGSVVWPWPGWPWWRACPVAGAERCGRGASPPLVRPRRRRPRGSPAGHGPAAHAADASVDPFWGATDHGHGAARAGRAASFQHRATPRCSRQFPGPAARVGRRRAGQPRCPYGVPDSPGFPHSPHAPRSTTPLLPCRRTRTGEGSDGSLARRPGDTCGTSRSSCWVHGPRTRTCAGTSALGRSSTSWKRTGT
ncbi:hypothetical protein QJS66_22710 [Kocuria rhizophila]|nr:hypothetical protein QJS66_22710 [Kocuria rhizophila]